MHATYDSPIGLLTLAADERGLTALRFPGEDDGRRVPADHAPAPGAVLADAVRQLDEYFRGERRRFDVAVHLAGTPFQRAVWERLLAIPYGVTITYGALARELGRPERVRAVAAAVGRTPVPIVVPCHRVIGADGSLTGYGGGLDRKQALLDLERSVAAGLGPEPAWAFRQLDLALG
jgi:methylated-DNA-[protein]-cysteine S-methyltransferase